jgi:hypothetical protein
MNPLSHYQRKNEYGKIYYEDDQGCYYEDLTVFLQCHILGFCGCGAPNKLLSLIFDLLLMKEEWSNNDHIDYKQYENKVTEYLLKNIETVKWFFDYFLDKKDITTHGGNVSGSWVDDDNFMDALRVWNETEAGDSP